MDKIKIENFTLTAHDSGVLLRRVQLLAKDFDYFSSTLPCKGYTLISHRELTKAWNKENLIENLLATTNTKIHSQVSKELKSKGNLLDKLTSIEKSFMQPRIFFAPGILIRLRFMKSLKNYDFTNFDPNCPLNYVHWALDVVNPVLGDVISHEEFQPHLKQFLSLWLISLKSENGNDTMDDKMFYVIYDALDQNTKLARLAGLNKSFRNLKYRKELENVLFSRRFS